MSSACILRRSFGVPRPFTLAFKGRPASVRTYVPSNNMTPGKTYTPDNMATPSTMGGTKSGLAGKIGQYPLFVFVGGLSLGYVAGLCWGAGGQEEHNSH